jgi:uncharacterized protein YbjT (DUF2867 family)
MEKRILIIGASGSQGGEVLKCLQKTKFKLRAFTRKESAFTKKASSEGVEIAYGNLDDENSLIKDMENVYGVFSVLFYSFKNEPYQEINQAKKLVSACEKSKVEILVHASVARAGEEQNFKNWENFEKKYPLSFLYWINKSGSIKVIKESIIPHWAIFKPAWMMDNFLSDKASLIVPLLKEGVIETSIKPETKLDLICAYDQAKFVRDAFENIQKYDKQEIPLASAKMTTKEIGEVLSKVLNKNIKAIYTEPELLEQKKGFFKPLVDSYDWNNYEGYKVDLEKVKEKGIDMLSFEDFCKLYIDRFDIL